MEKMSLKDYHGLAMRTSPRDGHDKVENGVLGLIGETGELVDLYKKWAFQSTPGTPFPMDAAINELGDVLWYLEELADGLNSSMNAISMLPFQGMDAMCNVIKPVPPIRRIVLNMSGYASKIRLAVDTNNRPELEKHMRRLIYAAAWLAKHANISIADAAERNIEKLRKRYPQGFDAKISMNRSMKEYE